MAERLGLKSDKPHDPTVPLREYGIGAQILRELGISKMVSFLTRRQRALPGLTDTA